MGSLISQRLYFFMLWLKRPVSRVDEYFRVYGEELQKGDPDLFALQALLALAED